LKTVVDKSAGPQIRIADKAGTAEFFGVSLPTIDKWMRDGMPYLQRGAPRVPWQIDLHAAAKWRYEARLPSGQIDPETLPPAERKLWYDGETRRRELQVRDRELIPESEVEQTVATAFSAVAQSMLALPDQLERRAGLTPAQSEIVQAAVHETLTELSERLSALATLEPES
jgi:phage terminase Nu1 subunit (DNA packaging protein)